MAKLFHFQNIVQFAKVFYGDVKEIMCNMTSHF